MNAYSMDLRQRVAQALDEGGSTQQQVAERFGVSTRWIRKLLRRRRQTGSLAPKPHAGGRQPAVQGQTLEKLRQHVRDQPDATLAELRDGCGIAGSLMCVWRALQRLQLTR